MSRLKLGSIIALLAGPFILVMNYLETSEKKQIDREGIETVAIPTNKIERRGRKGGRTYKLEVQYPVLGAGTQTAKVEVSRELYEKVDSAPILKVKYLKGTPSKLIVVGESLDSPEMNYVGIGVLLLGIVGTWWFFVRKQPQTQPSEPASA